MADSLSSKNEKEKLTTLMVINILIVISMNIVTYHINRASS